MDDNLNLERLDSFVHWFCSINLRVEWNRKRRPWHLRILKQKQVLFFNFVFGVPWKGLDTWAVWSLWGRRARILSIIRTGGGGQLGRSLPSCPSHDYLKKRNWEHWLNAFLLLLRFLKNIWNSFFGSGTYFIIFSFCCSLPFSFWKLTVCFTVSKRKTRRFSLLLILWIVLKQTHALQAVSIVV